MAGSAAECMMQEASELASMCYHEQSCGMGEQYCVEGGSLLFRTSSWRNIDTGLSVVWLQAAPAVLETRLAIIQNKDSSTWSSADMEPAA